jgi:hypothetical protein
MQELWTPNRFKGLCHEIRLIILNWHFLCVRWWFSQVLFPRWKKISNQSFSLFLWNYLLILKILSVTLFKDPKVAILTLKMHTGSRLWFCKIILEDACDQLILAHFLCSQWGVDNVEARPISEKGFLGLFLQVFSKLVCNRVVKSFGKTMKTISAYTARTA